MTSPSAPPDSGQPSAHAPSRRSWLKPRLDWLLVFVPVAIVLRFVPSLENQTALFVVSCLAIIPLAGWMGRATEHLAEHLGQGVGGLLNATFGNAAEHSSAILMALRNKMDISIGIAVGSSLQIALFVAPLLVFASYLFGTPMDLEFTVPEVVAVVASIIIVEQIASDGESNWIEGLQLLSVYAVLAVLFYFLPDVHAPGTSAPAH